MASKYFQEIAKEIRNSLPPEIREKTNFGKGIAKSQYEIEYEKKQLEQKLLEAEQKKKILELEKKMFPSGEPNYHYETITLKKGGASALTELAMIYGYQDNSEYFIWHHKSNNKIRELRKDWKLLRTGDQVVIPIWAQIQVVAHNASLEANLKTTYKESDNLIPTADGRFILSVRNSSCDSSGVSKATMYRWLQVLDQGKQRLSEMKEQIGVDNPSDRNSPFYYTEEELKQNPFFYNNFEDSIQRHGEIENGAERNRAVAYLFLAVLNEKKITLIDCYVWGAEFYRPKDTKKKNMTTKIPIRKATLKETQMCMNYIKNSKNDYMKYKWQFELNILFP